MTTQTHAISFDRAAVSARIADINGWYEVKKNPLSKVGVFEYHGSQLLGAPDPNKRYRIYRPAEELGSQETIDSFKLVPWVDDHTMLGDAGIPVEDKGMHGVIGEDVSFDAATGRLLGNIKVFSKALANAIDHGKRELSLGYRCVYDWTPGVFNGIAYDAVQRCIRGNHLALVAQGRMGPDVAVLDSAFSITIDSLEEKTMSEEDKTKGGEEGAGDLAEIKSALAKLQPLLEQIEELKATVNGLKPAATEEGDDAAKMQAAVVDAQTKVAALDSKLGEVVTSLKKFEENATKTQAALDAMPQAIANSVAKRDALVTKLKPFIGAFDSADKTYEQVVSYALDKLEIKDVPDAAKEATLNGYLHNREVPQALDAAIPSTPKAGGAVASYLAGSKKE